MDVPRARPRRSAPLVGVGLVGRSHEPLAGRADAGAGDVEVVNLASDAVGPAAEGALEGPLNLLDGGQESGHLRRLMLLFGRDPWGI